MIFASEIKAILDLDYRDGDFPEAECAAREMLSLLVYAELSSDQQAVVVDAIAAFDAGER